MRTTKIFALLGAMSIANTTWADCKDADPAFMARFTVKAEEVYDKQTDLTWQRCAVGQRWVQSSGCLGNPAKFTFDEAQALTNGKWRIPPAALPESAHGLYSNAAAVAPGLFSGTPPGPFWSKAFCSLLWLSASFCDSRVR